MSETTHTPETSTPTETATKETPQQGLNFADSATSSAGDSSTASSLDESLQASLDGSEGGTSEAEASEGAPGAETEKKKRRRKKKKPGGADASARPEGEAPRKEQPFAKYFGDGPRKHAFAAGEIVAGRVLRVENGAAVIDLFGKAVAYCTAHEPREVPIVVEAEAAPAEPASEAVSLEESISSAGELPAGSEITAAGDLAAADATQSTTEAIEAKPETPEEAPATEQAPEEPALEVGQIFRGRIASVSESGHIAISNRLGNRGDVRTALASAKEQHRRVFGLIYGFNRGGFDVMIDGVRAFCPASGLSLRAVENPETLLGQRLEFSVQQAKSGSQGLVVSRRNIVEREARKKAREVRRNLEVGQQLRGVVTDVREFGLFVDLGGIEGLVHISELSWDRTARPDSIAKPGDEVDVQVVKLSEGQGKRDGRIHLSMKSLASDPFLSEMSKFPEGTIVKGRVTRAAEFGAFVEIAPKVEGLLHVSELGQNLAHAGEKVSAGEEIYVVVERVDEKARRISLSKLADSEIKAFEEGTLTTAASSKPLRLGSYIQVKVEKVEPQGLLVQAVGTIGRKGRGFIPNNEVGTPRGADHRKQFAPGTQFDAKVLGPDRDGGWKMSRKAFFQDEERRAVHDYRKEAATKGFGTFADLLRSKIGE